MGPLALCQAPALDHAGGQHVVVLLVDDFQPKLRRHRQDDDANRQSRKKDDAEALLGGWGLIRLGPTSLELDTRSKTPPDWRSSSRIGGPKL